jgi:uncharacterized membrane protein YjfL (UPF0719 family)
MWRILGNVLEMFVYAAVYVVIALVAMKVVGTMFTPDFEKKITEGGNVALAIVCAALIMGVAFLLSSIAR